MTGRPRWLPGTRPKATATAAVTSLLIGGWAVGVSLPAPVPTRDPGPATTGTARAPAPAAPKRTSAQLQAALLRPADLTATMTVLPGTAAAGAGGASSRRPACAPLVGLLNSDRRPGARAAASITFVGEDGDLLDQTLDAMGSSGGAEQLVERYRRAVRACDAVTLPAAGGTAVLAAREVRLPSLGDAGFAARFTGRSGALRGFSVLLVVVQSADVVLGLTLLGPGAADATQLSRRAVTRVRAAVTGTTGGI